MPTFRSPGGSEPTISVADAQARMLALVRPLTEERVALEDASGRILRETVVAEADLPPHDNSAMDGYAVCHIDVASASEVEPARLTVIDDLAAGQEPRRALTRGTAIRIMTGAMVPPGADAVVPVEWTDAGRESVSITRPARLGANIRRRGEDVRAGATVMNAGLRIGAGEVGVLAALRRSTVSVGRRPRVGIISTGDELSAGLDMPATGKIANSNGPALAAAVCQAGGEPVVLGVVADDRDATIEILKRATSCDFIVSSGGVSAGAYDYVQEALAALGAELSFWRVAMKPGKPLLVATLDDRLVFGLPGNPVSCLVTFELFVAPAIRVASGESGNPLPARVHARARAALRGGGDRETFLRGLLIARGGQLDFTPMQSQGSHVSTSMIGANAFAVLPAGVSAIESGGIVDVIVLSRIAQSEREAESR